MTLKELQTELDAVDATLQRLRRSDFDIPGDPVFAAKLKMHIVATLQDMRSDLDGLVLGLDHVDDLDRLTLGSRLKGVVQGLIGGGDAK